jgi:hypothetical protein
MLKRCLAFIFILLTVGTVHAAGTTGMPAIYSLLLGGDAFLCAEANGLLWCRYADDEPAAGGASCNQVCALKGLTPIADDAAWTAAQDTVPECGAVRDAVELGDNAIDVSGYSWTCAEHYPDHGIFYCSTDPNCPDRHRTGSDSVSANSICPCE